MTSKTINKKTRYFSLSQKILLKTFRKLQNPGISSFFSSYNTSHHCHFHSFIHSFFLPLPPLTNSMKNSHAYPYHNSGALPSSSEREEGHGGGEGETSLRRYAAAAAIYHSTPPDRWSALKKSDDRCLWLAGQEPRWKKILIKEKKAEKPRFQVSMKFLGEVYNILKSNIPASWKKKLWLNRYLAQPIRTNNNPQHCFMFVFQCYVTVSIKIIMYRII